MHSRRRVLWAACCIACLFIPLLKPDGGIIFVAPLIVLTFPAGFLGDWVFGVLYDQLGARWAWDVASTIPSKWSYRDLLATRLLVCLCSMVRPVAMDRQAMGSSG